MTIMLDHSIKVNLFYCVEFLSIYFLFFNLN